MEDERGLTVTMGRGERSCACGTAGPVLLLVVQFAQVLALTSARSGPAVLGPLMPRLRCLKYTFSAQYNCHSMMNDSS